MDRRKFITGLTAAAIGSGLNLTSCSSMEGTMMNRKTGSPIPRRKLGRTGEELSVLGFGGIVVTRETPEAAANYVAEAFDRGVNYFDVAPSYGNAEERLGPALAPYRDRCFLACKTTARGAQEAEAELNTSLKRLRTDHVDLYQLHAITEVGKDVEAAFAPGGVMEAVTRAREAGKIRFVGFSAHSEQAAHAAMDRFDFDTVLFPFNFATWLKNGFGPSVLVRLKVMWMLSLLKHRTTAALRQGLCLFVTLGC